MIKRSTFCAGILLLGFLSTLSGAFAQAPSLAANDQYTVTVATPNGDETFTVIRDGRIKEQFYYVPIKPTIAVEKKDGKPTPVFQLLSYQSVGKDKELVQGGILQMSMVMGVNQETVDKIKAKLGDIKIPKGKTRLLSPLPIKSSELTLYDLGGDMLDQAMPKGGIAPIFGTQHFPFMLRLKELGTDVMAALCTKNGGLPVLITYTFQGMTPKAGFEVEVNWDACYKHFSSNTTLGIEVTKNAISGGLGMDIAKLREEFVANGLIEINSLSTEAVSSEQLDELMNPILSIITKELFEQIHPPTSIPAAEVSKLKDEPEKAGIAGAVAGVSDAYKKSTGTFFKAGVKLDIALKDVKIVKKGRFTYNFSRQSIVDRTTSFGGLLGIGNFSKEVQDKCISTMPVGQWESAYYVLPSVGDPSALGIEELSISVTLEEKNNNKWVQVKGQKIESAYFNKRKIAIWSDREGDEIKSFVYPLKAIYAAEGFKHENYRFSIVTTIKPKSGKSLDVTSYAPLFDGERPMPFPTNLVDIVTIDGSCLTYGLDPEMVKQAVGQLKAGKNSWAIKLTAESDLLSFLVPFDEKDIQIPSLTFASSKGKLGLWVDCKKNLRELDPGLYFTIFDGDWNENVDRSKLPEDAVVPFN